MNLAEVQSEIKAIYTWFHSENPSVKPQEAGTLSQLWSLADYMYREQAIDMTDAEIVYNFGNTTLREVGRA